MRKTLLCIVVLTALALGGCFGKKEESVKPVTCPDGTILTVEQVKAMPGHDAAGFNATSHCPVKPSVQLLGIPASLQVFKSAPFSWKLDAGSVTPAHSMLTSIRWYDRSVPDRDLTNINKYPTELIKREHQNLPITYNGNMSFAKVGKIYLRAYMEVGGVDYWSTEHAVNITPVIPTGKIVEVDIAMTGEASPANVDIVLGDAVQLVNSYPLDESCAFTGGPVANGPFSASMGVPAATSSDAIVFVAPGLYQYQCNDVQNHAFQVNVAINP